MYIRTETWLGCSGSFGVRRDSERYPLSDKFDFRLPPPTNIGVFSLPAAWKTQRVSEIQLFAHQTVHVCAKLNSWLKRFDRYADKDDKDSITDDGIQQFYTELGVDTQVRGAAVSPRLVLP